MATKTEKAIEAAMPGWKVVHTTATTAGHAQGSGHVHGEPTSSPEDLADSVTPSLNAVKTKLGTAAVGSPASADKAPPNKTKKLEFVQVVPQGLPADVKIYQKTVVCEDGEVIAIQG